MLLDDVWVAYDEPWEAGWGVEDGCCAMLFKKELAAHSWESMLFVQMSRVCCTVSANVKVEFTMSEAKTELSGRIPLQGIVPSDIDKERRL